MANTFKVVTFAAEPASAGTAYTMYTTPSSTTTIVLGLVLANIHTTSVTAEVELDSNTSGPFRQRCQNIVEDHQMRCCPFSLY